MKVPKHARRPNLATVVGSSLAVVAAGSLIAFSSLAEQAGLEGLATGRLQPAHPGRAGGGGRAITVPAPALEPAADPRDELVTLVRDAVARVDAPALAARPPVEFGPSPGSPRRPDETKPERPDRIASLARVAVAEPEGSEHYAAEEDGPPYGHAYGYHRKKSERPRPATRPGKGSPKRSQPSPDAPVYARSANDDRADAPRAPKTNKVTKVKGKGHAKHPPGHGKGKAHGNGEGRGKGKAKGHSKRGG